MSKLTFKWITRQRFKVLNNTDKFFKKVYEHLWNHPEAWVNIVYQDSISVPTSPDSYSLATEPDVQLTVSNEVLLQDIDEYPTH